MAEYDRSSKWLIQHHGVTMLSNEVRWFDAPSCNVFHTLNAYDVSPGGAGVTGEGAAEGNDQVIVDVVRHPRMFATVTNGPDEGDPVLGFVVPPLKREVQHRHRSRPRRSAKR